MKIVNNHVRFDSGFTLGIHQTVRLPEDGKKHSLPPSLGLFPMKRIEDYLDKVPEAWRGHGGVFIPMYEREAMWLSFSGTTSAVKVATGKVNAVSGGMWTEELQAPVARSGKEPEQDYMVAPYPQPWLDGFNTGEGEIRQFVAMQMGKGYTVEGQVTGKEDVGGIQILVMPSKPGAIKRPMSDYERGAPVACAAGGLESMGSMDYTLCDSSYSSATKGATRSLSSTSLAKSLPKAAEMGLAQGGTMKQTISADPHGIDTWDQSKAERIFIHIVNAELWEKITGEKCPPSPVSAKEYKGNYYKYDNGTAPVAVSTNLNKVKPVSAKDKDHGFVGQQDDSELNEQATNKIVVLAEPSKDKITDGTW